MTEADWSYQDHVGPHPYTDEVMLLKAAAGINASIELQQLTDATAACECTTKNTATHTDHP